MSGAGGELTNGELAARLRECLRLVEVRTGKGGKLQDSLSLLRGNLADSIPEARAARKALLGAVECGVADILRNSGGSDPLERGRCVALLVDEQCLSEEWAQRVVAIWIEALGGKSCDPVSSSANGAGSSHSRPGGPANTGVNSETPSAQTLTVLAALAPRDALRGLFAGFPGIMKDRGQFSDVAEILFAQDAKRCTRYVAVQRSGVMSRLVGQSQVNARDWERVISDLADVCGFSREVSVECASEWAYALNVAHPEDASVAMPPRSLLSWIRQVFVPSNPGAMPPSPGRGRAPRSAGDCLSLTLPGNVAMEFVWCPPGTFTMGSPESELGHFDDEVQHWVTLTKGFWMARYPITQLQYKALIGSNPSYFKGDARPVEKVSWHDSVAFCEKVNARLCSTLPEGFRCALPTEAQWEYACRAGTTSALDTGRELTSSDGHCPNLDAVAWYSKNSGGETHAVGQKRVNAWGLYDMHGNVWEWCRDWFGAYPTGSVTDPMGPEYGSYRVSRGGSWNYYARGCRSAYRNNYAPGNCDVGLGFRPVLAL